jgi:hypothetical protein
MDDPSRAAAVRAEILPNRRCKEPDGLIGQCVTMRGVCGEVDGSHLCVVWLANGAKPPLTRICLYGVYHRRDDDHIHFYH